MNKPCKRLYHLSLKYAKKFKQSWDYTCIALDTYADAYKQARLDCQAYYEANKNNESLNFLTVGDELEECDSEFKIGSKDRQ
jgi:hypothetical protein